MHSDPVHSDPVHSAPVHSRADLTIDERTTNDERTFMSIELRIPDVGESVQEVQIGRWLKKEGDQVEQDEDLVELETDKASMELPAPAAGVLAEILKQEGDSVEVGDVIARIDPADDASGDEDRAAIDESKKTPPEEDSEADAGVEKSDDEKPGDGRETDDETDDEIDVAGKGEDRSREVPATPAARRALRKHGLTAEEVEASGSRLRPEDVERHVKQLQEKQDDRSEQKAAEEERTGRPKASAADRSQATPQDTKKDKADDQESASERAVPMSLIRRRIAARLVEAQQGAALLTTFNEIDMSAVLELRQEFRERFEEEFGVRLGLMPFFVKAVIDALNHFPELNAEIREIEGKQHIVYKNQHHIGIAIGGRKGLVVPVLRAAERRSFAEIEEAIDDFAERAESNRLQPDELEGGTFTITNGGVYGSLLSTPIVNPPQSGVLGMHAIQDRPVAVDGQVVIRPMMYVALTYDHRIVDGREAVLFLMRVKEAIEEPARMLIEV